MSFMSLRKCHYEAIKGIAKIIVFLLKKCWVQCTALVLLVIFVYGVYGGLLAMASGIVGAGAVIYKVTDWFLFHPEDPPDSRINVASPSILRLPYESAFVKTADGVTINLVLVKQDSPEKFSTAPTFVYLHGNAGNIGHRLQNVSELYHYLGCNVLLVEYRGYGLSKGSPSESGLYLDAEASMRFLLQHPGIDRSQIVLFGRSLGGAVAIELAKNGRMADHVAAVIVENTFTSIPDIARILFDCKLVRAVPTFFYKNQFNSAIKVGKMSQPTLFLSGLQDELIPPSMMFTLYQGSASIMKHFHEFEHGTHNFTWRCADYYVIINGFLNKVLKSSSFARGYLNQQQVAAQLLQVQKAQHQQFHEEQQQVGGGGLKQGSPVRSASATPSLGRRSMLSSPSVHNAHIRTPTLPTTPSQLSLHYADSTTASAHHLISSQSQSSSQSVSNYSLEVDSPGQPHRQTRQIAHQVIEII